MRVLYLHQYFATRGRSTATRSYELARRLVERGHQVTIVSRDTRALEHDRDDRPRGRLVARETVDGIDVVYIAMPYSNYMSTPLRIASFIGFTKAAAIAGLVLPRPDVVFATSTPLTIGIPGLLVSRLKGVPFVFEIRDLWPAVPAQLGALRSRLLLRAAEWLELLLYREARRVVVLSEGSRDSLVERGVPAEKLVFIPNASDLDLFRPDHVDHGFRARLRLEGRFVALYTGAMGRANGLAQLVDAAAELQAAGGEEAVAFVCLGDGAERPRQQERAARLGLRNVHFLDPVSKNELAGIVGATDVTLTLFAPYPVLQTNSPNKFFDSLAAGRPAVVNLDGWLRRLVEENGAGAFVPPGDGAALAATLAALAREPEAVALMGRNARALAEREFDRDRMADRLAEALEAAVAESGGATTAAGASAADAGVAAPRQPSSRDCPPDDSMEDTA
jgi:glycosyltransferase involved in cell wall biosynthesis